MNHGCTYEEAVPSRATGVALLQWLTESYSHSTAEQWLCRIDEGRVTVDGKRVASTHALSAGERVVWERPPWAEPDVPLDYRTVFEDEHLLVVDKPSGLPTLPGGDFHQHSLLALLRQRAGSWAPVHRLGRGTSGLVVCAAPHAAAAMHRLFATRTVLKRYRARVRPGLTPQLIDAPIGPVPHPKMGTLFAVSPLGRPAQTAVDSVQQSEAELTLLTGRPHQIRIHLAHVGHPLEGDPLYGAFGVLLDARPSDLGYFLRAQWLELLHPISGQRLCFDAG